MKDNNFEPIWQNPKNDTKNIITTKKENAPTRIINVAMSMNQTPVEKKTREDNNKMPHKQIGRKIASIMMSATLVVGLAVAPIAAYKGAQALINQYQKVNLDDDIKNAFRQYTYKKGAQNAGQYWYDYDKTAEFVKTTVEQNSPYRLDNLLYGLYQAYGDYLPETQINEVLNRLSGKMGLETRNISDYIRSLGFNSLEEFLEKSGEETRKVFSTYGDPGKIESQINFGGR